MFDFLKKRISKIVSTTSKKITEKKVSEKDLENVFEDLEIGMLEADVAVEVIDKLKEDLKKSLVGKQVKRGRVKTIVEKTLKNSLLEILDVPKVDLEKIVKKNKPFLLIFLGFNGSGKTTTIAKVGYYLKNKKNSCVFAAGDSWRSAAIEQLGEHAEKLKVPMIKHKYGADPAAIIFDSRKFAEAKKIDVILADTAGRSHVNRNLMDELKKICRVNEPDLKVLVLDSLTGNDIIEQCRMFDEAVGVDALILSKMDVSKKGGSILSATYVLKKPILFLGVGQKYPDLKKFDKEWVVGRLLG